MPAQNWAEITFVIFSGSCVGAGHLANASRPYRLLQNGDDDPIHLILSWSQALPSREVAEATGPLRPAC